MFEGKLFSIWQVGLTAAFLIVPGSSLLSHEPVPQAIEQQLSAIRDAALESEAERAKQIFAEDLLLVSQSGKLYGRDAALADLGSGFDSWRNEDVSIRDHGEWAVVTLINHRKRKVPGMDPAAFRVVQHWHLREGQWRLVVQSSVRLKS